MEILQLNPLIPVVTPNGKGQAHFIVHDFEQDTLFGVFHDNTGEFWWFTNHSVRIQSNITQGHTELTQIKPPKGLKEHFDRRQNHEKDIK